MDDADLADFLSEIAATEAAAAATSSSSATDGSIEAATGAAVSATSIESAVGIHSSDTAAVPAAAADPPAINTVTEYETQVLAEEEVDIDIVKMLPFGATTGSLQARAFMPTVRGAGARPALTVATVTTRPAAVLFAPRSATLATSASASAASAAAAMSAAPPLPLPLLPPPPPLPPQQPLPMPNAALGPAATGKRRRHADLLRTCAGEVWTDATLADWPEGDFRLFCGDLGKEVDDNSLAAAFRHYPSFARARVVREKQSQKSKNFGFVSFLDAKDALAALKEMHGAYVGSRPVRLRRAEETEKSYVAHQREAAKKRAQGMTS